MNGQFRIFVHEVNCLLSSEMFDFVLGNHISFSIVDVSDPNINQSFKVKSFQAHSWSPMIFLKAGANRQRSSMLITTYCTRVCVDVWVGINPDYMKIFVLLKSSEYGRGRKRVVTSNHQRLLYIWTNTIQFLVSILWLKLVQCDHVRFVFTNVFENAVVKLHGTFINSKLLLPLSAGS